MLKKRLIISLCFLDGVLIRTKRFVPDYPYTQSYLAVDAVDEVILVDITPGGSSRSRAAMKAYADGCFAPVTMGGGVGSWEDARNYISLGADKVVVGSHALENPSIIGELASKLGSQSVVVAVDFPKYTTEPLARAFLSQEEGAGEIYLQDTDRDGSLLGYNLPVLHEIARSVSIPVVIGGGCGGWRSMKEAFDAGADGCVTSVIHHFTETSLKGFKRALLDEGAEVRA